MKTFNNPKELEKVFLKYKVNIANTSDTIIPVEALSSNYFVGHHNTTGNCQLFCVAWINYLLRDFSNPGELLKEMARKFGSLVKQLNVF